MATTKEKPSTALATVNTNSYVALQDGGEIAEAMAANMGEGAAFKESDLTRVPIPSGGVTTWIVPSITGDKALKSIEGILAYQTTRGLLWAKDTPEEGSLPVLVSHDLKTAQLVAPDKVDAKFLDRIAVAKLEDGRFDWAKLPQSEWGSGKNGAGKAVKEQRVLYILTEEEPLPWVVVIQPGSLKDWQKFIVSLTRAGIPFYRAVVSLMLEKAVAANGEPYAVVVPKLVGTLTKEQGDQIRSQFAEPMRGVAASAFSS